MQPLKEPLLSGVMDFVMGLGMPPATASPVMRAREHPNAEPRQTRPPWRVGRIRRTGIKRMELIGRRLSGASNATTKYNFDGTLNPLYK